MDWLDLEDVREWCRETDEEEATASLIAIGSAVEIKIENYLGRPVLKTESELGECPDGIVVNDCIKLAAKLLVSSYNDNRGAISGGVDVMPFGFDFLLSEYRTRGGL